MVVLIDAHAGLEHRTLIAILAMQVGPMRAGEGSNPRRAAGLDCWCAVTWVCAEIVTFRVTFIRDFHP